MRIIEVKNKSDKDYSNMTMTTKRKREKKDSNKGNKVNKGKNGKKATVGKQHDCKKILNKNK